MILPKQKTKIVAIMAELPGPKMRIGRMDPEPITLNPGDAFTLTTEERVGDSDGVSVSFEPLPQVVHPGDRLFLNDGLVQLRVERVRGNEVHCQVWTRVHREFFRDKPAEFDFRAPGKIFIEEYARFIASRNQWLGSSGQLPAVRAVVA